MKDMLLKIMDDYLKLFPDELGRQATFMDYLNSNNNLIDWNNFNGHVVASGFLYAKKEEKYLVIYHKDLQIFSYPGGHIDKSDANPLAAAIREIKEETGIDDFKEIMIGEDPLIPIDIDNHLIPYNERLDIPSHQHFDMRYLFVIDHIKDVMIDQNESSDYKWVSEEELMVNEDFGKIVDKFKKVFK
ncbi:MAG: NUDIX domain-containing protein [Bacilli bacterium]|nr:NUDIX domain-containing protein [Bacilli bacterium]